jgi:class 3 adenylate cyclase/CheY-like chemotaxis protein
MREPPLILIVDDSADNREILEARLGHQGYATQTAVDGAEALARVHDLRPDLVLLDVMMPKIDGIEVTRRLKRDPTVPFMPIILVTARTATDDLVRGLDAGADDYLTKPVDQQALLARVRSMLRIKILNDLSEAQKSELAAWNEQLEQRVAAQVREIERMARLRRFLPPQVADLVLAEEGAALDGRRIDVAVLFADLRGFSAFAEATPPEDVMAALAAFHALAGPLTNQHGGTLERFLGDGLVVLFNAPLPCAEPVAQAVRLAVALRAGYQTALARWTGEDTGGGHGLGLGIGIAHGLATVGTIGFEGRLDYAAIGSPANLAARLCAEAADGQILIDSAAAAQLGEPNDLKPYRDVRVKGFSRLIATFQVS